MAMHSVAAVFSRSLHGGDLDVLSGESRLELFLWPVLHHGNLDQRSPTNKQLGFTLPAQSTLEQVRSWT